MAVSRTLVVCFMLYLSTFVICKIKIAKLRYIKRDENESEKLETHHRMCKIILPHNLRYLENMLNADVVAKAAKIRQRIEANPNNQDSEKGWPMLLAKYQAEDSHNKNNFYSGKPYSGIYNRRFSNF